MVSWSLILGLYFFSGIEYSQNISSNTIIYVSVSLITYIVSFYYGTIINSRIIRRNILTSKELRINTKVLFIPAMIGSFIWIIEIYRLNEVLFGQRIENFRISLLGVLGYIFLSISLVIWLLELTYSLRYGSYIRFHGIVSAIIFLIPSVITAGRQSILIIIVSSTIIMLYSLRFKIPYNIRRSFKIVIVCLIAMITIYLIYISDVRSGVSNKIALFEYILGSTTSQDTINFANLFGPFKDLIMEGLYYYSHELPMFEVFFREYDGPKFLGFFQFHYIGRRLPISWGLNYDNAWYYIDLMSERNDLYSHVWRTALSSIIVDFGRIGAQIYISILGILSGRVYNNYNKSETSYNFVLLAIICTGVIFSIQYSPFNETGWAYPLFWILLLPLMQRFKIIRIRGNNVTLGNN